MLHCEMCDSDFTCGKLYSALKVVETFPNLNQHRQLKEIYDSVIEELASNGWKYPTSKQPCVLAKNKKRVIALTDTLIKELDKARTMSQ